MGRWNGGVMEWWEECLLRLYDACGPKVIHLKRSPFIFSGARQHLESATSLFFLQRSEHPRASAREDLKRPTLQHSNTPTLQHSNAPMLQYSNTPILQYSNTPILQYSNTPGAPSLHLSGAPSLPPLLTQRTAIKNMLFYGPRLS
jgi:hypothetical protein